MNSVENKISAAPPAPLAASPEVSPGTAANENQPKLSRWAVLVVIGLIVLLIAGLIPRWLHRRALGKENLELAISSVRVISAAPGKATSSLLLPAEVRPFVEAPIYARASGFVKRWYVDIGARVTAGQLLADIDTPELEQQISGARAELVQAQAAESLARITASRWSELLKTSSVSEQENAEKQADLQLKIAAVDTAKANVARLEDLQSFTHVIAPFSGILTARLIDVGDLIGAGKELFRLSDTSKLRVFVRVPQPATPGIAVGQAAEMMVPELPARKFVAKVVRTSGAIDASSRTMLTELEVDNPNNEILAGSYAQVNFADLKQDPPLVLPATVLLFRGEGMQVGVVDSNDVVSLRNVSIGRDFGKTVEITAGITAQDKIINSPVDSLTDGMKVRIAEQDAGIPQ